MINWILNAVKQTVAKKELEKLHRYEILTRQYRQWLAEFPDIRLILDNMQVAVHGKDFSGEIMHYLISVDELRSIIRMKKPVDVETINKIEK